jgi:uncharacterized protein with FMN-binding domain
MRRAPIVLTATVAGVAGVLSFHAQPQQLSPATTPTSTAGAPPATTGAKRATTAAGTAVGVVAQNQYGNVQVKVTVAGGKIKDVTALQLPQTDPKSAQISQYAAPQLQSEVLAAQSAKIDGVSGASYTSQSYDTSLQSALDKLGYKS